jgi:putative transposase
MSTPDRRARLDRDHGVLSIRRQCQLLGLARAGVYRTPAPPGDDNLALMRGIDELFTAWPFLGSRRMAQMLGSDGRRMWSSLSPQPGFLRCIQTERSPTLED